MVDGMDAVAGAADTEEAGARAMGTGIRTIPAASRRPAASRHHAAADTEADTEADSDMEADMEADSDMEADTNPPVY